MLTMDPIQASINTYQMNNVDKDAEYETSNKAAAQQSKLLSCQIAQSNRNEFCNMVEPSKLFHTRVFDKLSDDSESSNSLREFILKSIATDG